MHEVEKNSLIDLPAKGGTALKSYVFDKVFYGDNSSRVGLLIRLGYVQGLYSFNLASEVFLWNQMLTHCICGVLILKRGLKTLSYVSLEVIPGTCPKAVLLFLGCSFLTSASFHFPDEKLFDPPFGTQGGSWKLNRRAPMPRKLTGSYSVSLVL